MGTPRTLAAVTVTAGTPTPVFTGPVTAAVSFSIKNGIATIILGAGNLPTQGYNGPNGYIAPGTSFDIHGPNSGMGQQVTLWLFTTATYFNGKTITVIDNNPVNGSFRFYFNHADVNNTADTGNTAPIPVQQYRAVRIEMGQGDGTDKVYVGDGNVSSSQYVAALSLTGQIAVEIASDNIRANRIFIDGTSSSDTAQISLIY